MLTKIQTGHIRYILSQPTFRWEGEARLKGASSKEGRHAGVVTNVYSRKMLEKSKRDMRVLRIKVWELFTCGEGISTPCVRHKGRRPLIKCAKSWLQYLFIFPFFVFFIFRGWQEHDPYSYVSSSAKRNLDLCSS